MASKTQSRIIKAKRKNRVPLGVKLGSFVLFMMAFAATVFLLSGSGSQEPEMYANDNKVEIRREDFIKEIAPHAQQIQQTSGILSSVIIGQAILESDFGQSELAKAYNNLFGVKAGENEEKVLLKTKEFSDGKWHTVEDYFKVYPDWNASIDDHAHLFLNGVTWNPALYQGVVVAADYKTAAQELQNAGYATDPTYADKIIEVIESYDLTQYDLPK